MAAKRLRIAAAVIVFEEEQLAEALQRWAKKLVRRGLLPSFALNDGYGAVVARWALDEIRKIQRRRSREQPQKSKAG